MTGNRGAPLVGISVADYSPLRGHTHADVYSNVDYIEYGGFTRPGESEEVRFAYNTNPALYFGRHLVSTELHQTLDHKAESERVLSDMAGRQSEYFLTDVGFWFFGGSSEDNLWPRPCSINQNVAARVKENCRELTQILGVSLLPENPAIVYVDSEITIAEFMADIGRDLDICLDIGHFWAFCKNYGLDVAQEASKLPFNAIRVIHIAGLSKVEFGGKHLYLDNHDVVPMAECLALLHHMVERCPNLGWVTYEAEMASTDVQLTGLRLVKRACGL